MNTKHINFRTKTHAKTKSMSLSHNFTQIEKVLAQYQKKKFHPKIQNFHYMSAQSISKTVQKRKYLPNKQAQSFSSQNVFGPLPQAFKHAEVKKITQKSYDISQITLASSQEKQTYTKMSKIRNPQKRRRLKQAYPKNSQRYIQSINKNFIELLGKQVQYMNSVSSRETFQEDENQFVEFQKQRNFIQTKTQPQGESGCKKYAQIQLQEFLQENTKLTMSQKRRITEYKKRDELVRDSLDSRSSRKYPTKTYKQGKSFILINDYNDSPKQQRKAQSPQQLNQKNFQEEPINFSSKGWVIALNNDSNIMTL